MKAFDYAKPSADAEAIRAGQAAGARFIAGGTLLVDLLRLDVERPDSLVDLNGLQHDRDRSQPRRLAHRRSRAK